MKKAIRVNDLESLVGVVHNRPDCECVVLGHESCPIFYRETPVDEMIHTAREAGLQAKVNIPIVFEDYLEYFKDETARLLKTYPDVKLILNDWGMVYYLHMTFPEVRFAVGLGLSFSYADCPWNHHIVSQELEKYQDMLQSHNMESRRTLSILKECHVDEIIVSDLKILQNAYRIMKEQGMSVTMNQNVNIVTISRACHILRILGKTSEKGSGCSRYCRDRTTISTTHYYDMALQIHDRVSEDTMQLQPEMVVYANILFSKNEEQIVNDTYEHCDMQIEDYRY